MAGISLTYIFKTLPAILHKQFNYTTLDHSKGARGLSVYL